MKTLAERRAAIRQMPRIAGAVTVAVLMRYGPEMVPSWVCPLPGTRNAYYAPIRALESRQ